MHEVADLPALRAWRRTAREAGRRVALVPTMGFLHEGHLALVEAARRRADLVVMSVFVNPLQFGPNEDFDRYPRDLERDRALARERGVDLMFVPTVTTMYPPGAETRIVPGPAADRWEGAVRPGHFVGVLTVVAKLFHLVEPTIACFGQKDFQQVTLVRSMVRDLNLPVEVVVVPTVREADGLALSSRNVYLAPAERRDAPALSRGLGAAAAAWRAGERSGPALEAIVGREVTAAPGLRADYIAAIDPDQLQRVDLAVPGTILAVAARVSRIRLIDNLILE
ncbi:MAG TPA: pantoate--beta-alanine ligase [Gemmatimonadales bacterium]|nr:pantoate--beta-alanine ligase [Gemmatimonadales bacterium]